MALAEPLVVELQQQLQFELELQLQRLMDAALTTAGGLAGEIDPAAPAILFTCEPDDEGVAPPPQPARAALPDWFRRLPPITTEVESVHDNGLTAKRCLPFLDAMMIGWIIPLAATVRLQIAEGGTRVDYGWRFDQTLISDHAPHQIAGNPAEPRPPLKFHNVWTIRTPPGWSCLFLPPLNRPHPAFECFSGVVDTDRYTAPVHFLFVATGEDGLHIIERGTPLVQVIPFRREAPQAEVRVETGEEAAERRRLQRLLTAEDGWYRTQVRAER